MLWAVWIFIYQSQRDDGGISRRMRESNGSRRMASRDGEVNPPLYRVGGVAVVSVDR